MTMLTEKDLAARWKVTTRTLKSWRASGNGPAFVPIGPGTVRYRPEDVEAYERSRINGEVRVTAEMAKWEDRWRYWFHHFISMSPRGHTEGTWAAALDEAIAKQKETA